MSVPDHQLDPEDEAEPMHVEEMQCPEEQHLSCAGWRTRSEMLEHYKKDHAEYGAMDMEAIEVIFDQEAERREQNHVSE